MVRYRVMRARAELHFYDSRGRERAERDLELGCTYEHDPDPELVAEFETLEAAQIELAKYECTYSECQGGGKLKFYYVEEYYIAEVMFNEEGEEIDWEFVDYAKDEISLKKYKVTCKAKFGNHDAILSDLVKYELKKYVKARTEKQACEIAMENIWDIVDETDDYDSEISRFYDYIEVFNENDELIEVYEEFNAELICD